MSFFSLSLPGHLISPEDIHNSNSIGDDDKWPTFDLANAFETTFASNNKTFFRTQNNSIIVSQVGSVVMLPCRAHLIADEMVSEYFLRWFNCPITININCVCNLSLAAL